MAMARPKPTVERTVQFFRAIRPDEPDVRPYPFDPTRILETIDRLGFESGDRYFKDPIDGDGDDFCCWPLDPAPFWAASFARIRRKALPQVEKLGKRTPLSLEARAGLAEEIFVRFFRDGVAGVVYNFHGPRMSRLSEYFRQKASGVGERVQFDALIRPNLLAQLDALESIHMVELRLRRSAIAGVRDPRLREGLQAIANAGEPEFVAIALAGAQRRRAPLSKRVFDSIRGLFSDRAIGAPAPEGVERCVVKGVGRQSGEIVVLDLLKEHIVSKQSIVAMGARTKVLDPRSALAAIEKARQELWEEIHKAATLGT